MNIPDEAVEAAWHAFWNHNESSGIKSMRAALEAAAPHLVTADWSAEDLAANYVAVKEHK